MKRFGIIFLAVFALLGFVISLLLAYHHYIAPPANSHKIQKAFTEKQLVSIDPSTPKNSTIETEAITQENSDYIAWLYIPGTEISQPIVQAKDNSFYLTHSFDGTYSPLGSVFLDASATPNLQDKNTLIFGHIMLGTHAIFTDLLKFKDANFFADTPYIYVFIAGNALAYEVISAYETSVYDASYLTSFAASTTTFDSFLNTIQAKSLHPPSLTLSAKDTIITLSTCTENTRKETPDARFVVHARRTNSTSPP